MTQRWQWQSRMLVFAILAVGVAALAGCGTVSAKDGVCTLNLQTQLVSRKEPLILEVNQITAEKEQLEMIRPKVEINGGKAQGEIHVAEHKKLLIACTGLKNKNVVTQKQTAYVECSDGLLTIDGQPADRDTLSCTGGVANSYLEDTKEKCGKGDNVGTKFELGFKLTDEKPYTFLPLVEVCHNKEKMVSYYSSHDLYGASLLGAVKSSDRRSFSPGPRKSGLYRGVNVGNDYKQTSQKQVLDNILGEGAGEDYLSSTVFLARGHLAPDADFIYNSGQQLTYYYINAAPQWQTFNAGNWLQIENAVRDLAAKRNATLNVVTGTYGVLELNDLKGKEKKIYLHPASKADKEGYIPVPEVYWKLVRHPGDKTCTVAVGHNNVFLKKEPKKICKSVNVDGWPKLDALDKGYVYYCDYKSFKQTVSYVPEFECKGTLEFPPIHEEQ